jgi:hypothetical protein
MTTPVSDLPSALAPPPAQGEFANSSRPLQRWHGRARWFAAEFFVVITGVLVALGLQAWYQNRQDRAREGVYLTQIVADLRETESRIARADSAYQRGDHAITSMALKG